MTDPLPLDPLPPTASRLSHHGAAIAFLAISVIMALGLACLGLAMGEAAMGSVATVLFRWFTSGGIALGLLLAALGFGWPVARLLATSAQDRLCVQPAGGLAALLFIDHLVGVLGGFSGGHGRVVAGLVMVAGIVLLVVQAGAWLKQRPRLPQAPWTALLGCTSVAVLLVAACNPPGVLWRSEAGGFDALSYHLPLAQEWASAEVGRIWPLTHNVYSFLPSYAESAFTQIAALTGGSLVTNDGVGAVACQFLHVGQSLIAAFTVGALAAAIARRCGIGAWLGGGLAFATVLSVPWTVVTGSLAYNEMPAVALAAGAALAAVSDSSIARRGLSAGLLMGAGAACKLTFVFMAGPTVGLLLLTTIPARQWHKALLMGVVGGLVTLGPPLARNWIACGNPVFPLSTKMGLAHWNQEQADRFHKAHGREGTIGQQVKLLLAPSPDKDPITGRAVTFDGEARGVFHGQWAMMFPAGIGAAVLLLARRQTRATGAVLVAGVLAGWVFWTVATHGQARFLIPLLPNLACGLGVLGASLFGDRAEGESMPPLRRLSLIFVCVMPLLASATTARLYLTENRARPNEYLTSGMAPFTGEALAERFDQLSVTERSDIEKGSSPPVYAAVMFKPGDKLLMLGDARPLNYLCPVIYSTVWDRSVVGLAMEQHPDEPAAWTRAVQKTGATFIYFNHAEIARYNETYGFDPAITKDRLETWIMTLGIPIRGETDGRGRKIWELFEVPADALPTAPARSRQPASPPAGAPVRNRP